MNNEIVYTISKETIIDDIPQLKVDQQEILETHVELIREIQNIYNHFHLFYYNIQVLHNNFDINGADSYTIKSHCPQNTKLFHGVNAQVVNCISSGKSMVEVIQGHSIIKSKMQPFISSIYDNNFHYRFVIRMRDLCQHGHLPLGYDGRKFFFDFFSLPQVTHYNWNSSIKREMDNIAEEIISKYGMNPRIAVINQISGFTVQLIAIVEKYFSEILFSLEDSVKDLENLLMLVPGLEMERSVFGRVVVLFADNKGERQAFSNGDYKSIVLQFQTEMQHLLEKESRNYKLIVGDT